MRGRHSLRIAALALGTTLAALPSLAFAEGEDSHAFESARVDQLIESAIQGNADADRQEAARIDRLVQQALQRAGVQSARQSREGPDASLGLVPQGDRRIVMR